MQKFYPPYPVFQTSGPEAEVRREIAFTKNYKRNMVRSLSLRRDFLDWLTSAGCNYENRICYGEKDKTSLEIVDSFLSDVYSHFHLRM